MGPPPWVGGRGLLSLFPLLLLLLLFAPVCQLKKLHVVQYMSPPKLQFVDGKWKHGEPQFCMCLLTAAIHNVSVQVVGPVWRPECDKSPTPGQKVRAWRKFVDTLPDGDQAIFTDALDVFFLRGAKAIARSVARLPLKKSVIFNGERNCWPEKSTYCLTAPRPTTFAFINSGALVAEVGPRLRRLMDAWDECSHAGIYDQPCIQQFVVDDPAVRNFYQGKRLAIDVDYNCTLFQSAFITWFDTPDWNKWDHVEGKRPWLINGRVVNPETNRTPAFLHMNGGTIKTGMPRIFNTLFPNASWALPSVQQWRLNLWGKMVRGADLCAPYTENPWRDR